MTPTAIARLFSAGKFEEAAPYLADSVEWFIYEEDKHFSGQTQVMAFAREIASYFASITTDFREYGLMEQDGKVAVYGYGKFIRDGEVVNEVNSCDVYEFDGGMVVRVHSYCNSKKK
ncbi:hypothetical protein [uncultured Chitinophaga sp.]|uniref:nuclear transport factor 2 family protein n=1 Tax=uncultured Chitinophaga sp. TaxID=339340 RepID=UPI0025DC59C8|nr:hypothetical protein [uncultured Chitinophaga sp.]